MGRGMECGAVTGAFMILGFKVKVGSDERETRYRTYDLVKEFVRLFETRHGTIICKELLDGVDPGSEEGRKEAIDRNLFRTRCPEFVKTAVEILENIKTK
jgi:C_GCAxxG_C_C family probable redox protein